MNAGSVKKREKGKARMSKDEDVDPFKPSNVKVMGTCFVDKNVPEENVTCFFQGQFQDKEKNRCSYMVMPDSFARIHKKPQYMNVFKSVGLDAYFSLPPCAVDIQRSYELMSSINKDGIAKITNMEGEETEVRIDEEVINEALHFRNRGVLRLPHRLTNSERRQTFLDLARRIETFRYMNKPEVVVPCMLFSQHFHIGKPPKYTIPNKRVANFMTSALQKGRNQPRQYARLMYNDLIEHPQLVNFKKNPHIDVGHMLTRISYQALGASDQLPLPISQRETSGPGISAIPPAPRGIIPPRRKETAQRSKRFVEEEQSELEEQTQPGNKGANTLEASDRLAELRINNRQDPLVQQARMEREQELKTQDRRTSSKRCQSCQASLVYATYCNLEEAIVSISRITRCIQQPANAQHRSVVPREEKTKGHSRRTNEGCTSAHPDRDKGN